MDLERTLGHRVTRRTVLGIMGAASATLVLAACDSDDEEEEVVPADEPDEEPEEEAAEEEEPVEEDEEVEEEEDEEDPDHDDEEMTDEDEEEDDEAADADADAHVIVSDVIDFHLAPDGRWDGPFGTVTMRLHHGWVDGEDLTFIRTDASDEEFASEEGLVYVPLMANALDAPGSFAHLYLFRDGLDDQRPVMSVSPADGENFTPAFRIHYVSGAGDLDAPLTSMQEIEDADVEIEETDIIVNYPVVTWPGGQIPVDEEKVEGLGGGQLIEDPDLEAGEVTLKLHQCYPGSRYIITDTSMAPMAPMMGAGEAEASQLLIEAGAVAPITIFLNGLEGTGAMGFQPGVFNTSAGDPAWSPFWEHFAAEWENPEEAVAVTSQRQLDDLVEEGALTLYNGVPDSHPDSFVVNCSVPILASVTWEPPEE